MKRQFPEPELSTSNAHLAAHQLWRAHPATGDDAIDIWQGQDLAKRLFRIGIIVNAQQLVTTPVGSCIKTGVSAYERIR